MRRKDPNERKDKVSIALKIKTIKALDILAKAQDRSRSDIIQRILDKQLPTPEKPTQPTEARRTEIPFIAR